MPIAIYSAFGKAINGGDLSVNLTVRFKTRVEVSRFWLCSR